jgi:magnesium transporter
MARGRRRRRRTPPGTAPGTLQIDPKAPPPALRVMAFGPDSLEERAVGSVEELPALLGRKPVLWLNVDGLGDEGTLLRLGEIFGLHRLALEDVVGQHQRAKIEPYADHLFIVARVPQPGERLETEQLSLFLGRDFLLTFQERPGDCFDPIRERLRKGGARIRSAGPDYLAYALLDAVVDSYFPVLEAYGEGLDALEDEVVERPERRAVSRIHEVKRDLLTLRRTIWPLRELLNALLRDPSPLVADETRTYLRDCYDHAIQIMDMVETYREISSSLTEAYLSSLSNRMNEVMKVLTVIATIFMPLGFLAGLYGMNFRTDVSPWNMPELGWRFGYPFCLGVMAAAAVAMLIYFRRKGWIGSSS